MREGCEAHHQRFCYNHSKEQKVTEYIMLIVCGIELRIPENQTVYTLHHEKSGRRLKRYQKGIDPTAKLMDRYSAELSEDEKYYLKTGIEIKRF